MDVLIVRPTKHVASDSMKPAAEDIRQRRIAWEALSDLYLDTDTSLSREWRVERLMETDYTTEDLETILVNEVHPVCRWNMMCVAGEWAAFDPDWLETKILRQVASPSWFRLPFVGTLVRRHGEWRATKDALSLRRSSLRSDRAQPA
ncbi:MAG: hypothetical protein ACK5GK_06660 [Akkermansiaceae bacterium]|nr:hypothetical protein [Luteolibacter sp.]